MHASYYTLILVSLLLGISTLIGRAATARFPFHYRGSVRLYLSPVMGAAALFLLSIPFGWIVNHGGTWLARGIVCGAVFAGIWWDKDRRGLARHLLLVITFGALASWPVFTQLQQYGVMNPYNDTFTYLAHAQWLQDHSFPEVPDYQYHPAWTQIAFYQNYGMRMGASFFLAWVQRLMGAAWSLDVYPGVMSFGAALAGLGLAAGLTVAAKARSSLAFAGGLYLPLTLNGFAFGVTAGFLPQTYGLAFGLSGVLLLGMVLEGSRACKEAPSAHLKYLAATAGLLLACCIHAYTEWIPFVGVVCFSSLAWAWWVQGEAKCAFLTNAAIVAGTLVILVNLEWLRAFQALRIQSGVVVGWPVPWDVWDFWMHAIGWKSGSGDGLIYLSSIPWLHLAAGLIALAFAGICFLRHFPRKFQRLTLVPHIILTGLFLAAFLLFRYKVVSPWPEGVGQTWNQYKLSQWAGPSLLLLLGCSLADMRWHKRQVHVLLTAGMVLTLLLAGATNYQHASTRTLPLCIESEAFRNFAAFHELRKFVKKHVKTSETIYLDITGTHHKQRQMVAYFLYPFRLVSDWRDDGYISSDLNSPYLLPSRTSADWVISPSVSPIKQGIKVAQWRILHRPEIYLRLTDFQADYDREADESGWWHWTKQKAVIRFAIENRTKTPRQYQLKFQCLALRPKTNLVCHIAGERLDTEETLEVTGWGQYLSRPFTLPQEAVEVRVSTDAEPSQPAGDSRLLGFLIKNVDLIPVEATQTASTP